MSSSGGAPHAGTPSRAAVIAGEGRSPDPPSPCPHCDHAPSDPSAAATPVALCRLRLARLTTSSRRIKISSPAINKPCATWWLTAATTKSCMREVGPTGTLCAVSSSSRSIATTSPKAGFARRSRTKRTRHKKTRSFGDQSRSRSRGLRRPRSPSRSCSPRPLSRRSRSRDRRSRSRGHSPHGHRPTENNLFRSMDY